MGIDKKMEELSPAQEEHSIRYAGSILTWWIGLTFGMDV